MSTFFPTEPWAAITRWARRLPVLALLLPSAPAWAQAASTYGFVASAGPA